MSFLGVYQGVLFWARAVQNVLLLLVTPLFLALGRPLTLLIAARPGLGARAEAIVHSRAARVLTFPAITAMVLVIVPFLLYFTPWYEAGLRNDLVRELTYAALIVPGLVFFWTLLRVDPVPKAYPYLVSLWVTGVEVVADAVLGLAIIADEHLIAGSYYQALGRPWGPSLRADRYRWRSALDSRRSRGPAVPRRPAHPDDQGRRAGGRAGGRGTGRQSSRHRGGDGGGRDVGQPAMVGERRPLHRPLSKY